MPTKKVQPGDRKYIGNEPTEEQLAGMEERKHWIQDQWTDQEREVRRCGVVPHMHRPEYKTGIGWEEALSKIANFPRVSRPSHTVETTND